MKKKVFFLNDTHEVNGRYRSSLMKHFEKENYTVNSLGLIDLPSLLIQKEKGDLLISSNIRANIISMLIGCTNTSIILNGLGRFGKYILFRKVIGLLLSLKAINVLVQNHRDYRYFRRFYNLNSINWVLGSGAVSLTKTDNIGFFNITRNNKIKLCLTELNDFINLFNCSISLIGVTKLPNQNDNLKKLGWVPLETILHYGDKFVWFGGYGDGFPHSLACALYNRVPTFISKREFIRLGIYQLNKNVKKMGRWYFIPPQCFDELSCNEVNKIYAKGHLLP